jgi:hypothetical protein
MRDKSYGTALHINPNATYRELRDQIVTRMDLRRVTELFQRMRMRKWKKPERPRLTDEVAAKRLAWTETYTALPDL